MTMASFQTAGTTPFIQLWLKIFKSTVLEQALRCFSISPVIPSGPGAFLVFTFFKASFSSFMLKGSVIEQSCSSPYNDRIMFCVSSLTSLMRSDLFKIPQGGSPPRRQDPEKTCPQTKDQCWPGCGSCCQYQAFATTRSRQGWRSSPAADFQVLFRASR